MEDIMFNFNRECHCNRPQRPCGCVWENPCFRPNCCNRPHNNCNWDNNIRNSEENDNFFNDFNDFDDNYQNFNNDHNNYYPQDFGNENEFNRFKENHNNMNNRCHRPCPPCQRPQQNCCNRNACCLLAGCLFGRCCCRR